VAHASFACHLQDAFVAALNADFGHRARQESLMLDVGTTVGAINYLQRNLRRFCAPSGGASPPSSSRPRQRSSISRSAWLASLRLGTYLFRWRGHTTRAQHAKKRGLYR